ncbi:hypothetical protein DPMN_053281 [Dreissena polymorpha]|uniref:Uncharacterized protein n=1 Tax=Dreissena polymorpha TaxID=45954 RepID=A0A9D4HNP5_DREPO|nr:hypothetical protein DPMN_053281 [Dreissena polymorpha]
MIIPAATLYEGPTSSRPENAVKGNAVIYAFIDSGSTGSRDNDGLKIGSFVKMSQN